MAEDDLAIPPYLLLSQEERRRAWEENPPKAAPFSDPRLEASKALRAEQKKIETAARIERMKASLAAKAQRPERIDPTGMRWNVNRSRWEPEAQETTEMSKQQVDTYNELVKQANALGLKNVAPTSRFSTKAAGDRRIADLQAMIKAKQPKIEVTPKAPKAPKEEKEVATGITAEFKQRVGGNRQSLLFALEEHKGKIVSDADLAAAVYGDAENIGAMRMVMKGLLEACPKHYEIKREEGGYGLFDK